ncbi:MAG: hypothetical protein IKC05_07745, partial [Lentisphaeria bacterium]|nr:hypothetical protein [Lentisphaeria bacterium]
MNRAILIVICDFLVSAMLSMMTGMVPSHTGGTGVGLDENTTQVLLAQLDASKKELERVRRELREAADKVGSQKYDAQLREIAKQLAENRLKREQLEDFLRRKPTNTGKLSPETLKKNLDDEKLKRYQTEIELRERLESLRRAQADIKDYRAESASLRKELTESGKALRDMTKSYSEAQRQIARAEADAANERKIAAGKDAEIARREAEISRKDADLSRKDADLAAVRDALKEMSNRVGRSETQTRKLQNSLAYTTGKLSTTERDLAGYRDRLNRLHRELSTVTLQRNEARRNRDEMEKLVRKTVADLTRAQTDLEQTRIAAEKDHKKAITAEAKLTAAKTMLEDTRRQLQSNVLESYSDAAVRLRIQLLEERFIMNQRGGGLYYLPLVKFNNRTFLTGHFRTLAGNAEVPLMFRNITTLAYKGVKPGSNNKEINIPGPLLSLPQDPHVAAIEVKLPGIKPLEVLTRSQLAKRGTARLYLFKNRSFGRESAELGGRCSYDLFNKSGNLIIRNALRGT